MISIAQNKWLMMEHNHKREGHHGSSVLQPVSCILSACRFIGTFHPDFNLVNSGYSNIKSIRLNAACLPKKNSQL